MNVDVIFLIVFIILIMIILCVNNFNFFLFIFRIIIILIFIFIILVIILFTSFIFFFVFLFSWLQFCLIIFGTFFNLYFNCIVCLADNHTWVFHVFNHNNFWSFNHHSLFVFKRFFAAFLRWLWFFCRFLLFGCFFYFFRTFFLFLSSRWWWLLLFFDRCWLLFCYISLVSLHNLLKLLLGFRQDILNIWDLVN